MVPPGDVVADFRVNPRVLNDVVNEDALKLSRLVPASVENDLVLVWNQRGGVAASRVWLLPFGLNSDSLEVLAVEHVQVVEGGPLVAHSPMASEHVNAILVSAFVIGHRMVCSWRRRSDFGFRVLWLLVFLLLTLVCWHHWCYQR